MSFKTALALLLASTVCCQADDIDSDGRVFSYDNDDELMEAEQMKFYANGQQPVSWTAC